MARRKSWPREHALEGPPRAQRSEHAGRTHAAPLPGEHPYSADEERLVRRDPEKTLHFVTDLYQHATSSSGALLEERFRLYAGDREVAQVVRENGVDKTLFFHADNLGTPDTITTDQGDVVRQEFDPFGSEVEAPSTELTRVGFTGHQHDRDLGLVDMRGRMYDPLAARFTTPDPIMQAPFWSQGLNRYAYTFNDPVNNVDPSGFQVDGVSEFIHGADTAYTFSPDPLNGSAGLSNGVPGGLGSALGLIGTAANVIAKATGAGGGFAGTTSTPERQLSSGASGRAAPATRPAPGGMNARNQNSGVRAPVQAHNPEWGPPPDLSNTAGPHGHAPPGHILTNPEFVVPDTSAPYEAFAEGLSYVVGGPEVGVAKGAVIIGRGIAKLGGKAAAPGAARVVSRIGGSAKLAREAEAAGRSAQRSIDHLTSELARGNLNPGIGTKSLGKGISYARARDGARVFFRKGADGTVEILGKATKNNEQAVINEVLSTFGK